MAIYVEGKSRDVLTAPFPYFGGKRTVAAEVWARFGDVSSYVEPFFGSGAVLLSRPHAPKTETINDADHFVANFWRAIQADPAAVARHADWPVNETDLSARHHWLVTEGKQRLAGIEGDPALYDAQVAGWWAWGLCSWIGSGWCSGEGPWQWGDDGWGKSGAAGINRKRPHLGNDGQGINRQLPHLGAGQGINRQHNADDRHAFIAAWFQRLADRLRGVRVCAGDWSRVTGPSVTTGHGMTGIFLDPPYADTAGRDANLYTTDSLTVAHDVREWAIENGSNPLLRICLCGYDGEHAMPQDWAVVEWKAQGGYGSQSDDDVNPGRANSHRERLWFSPACIMPHRNRTLFDLMEVAE